MSALGSLVASLSLEFSSFRQGLTAAEQNATSASQVIQQRLDNLAAASEKMGSRTAAAMERSAGAMESVSVVAGRLGGVLGSIVSAVSVSQLAAYSDTWANFNNRLKIVTSTQGEFTAAQGAVLRIAAATRQPLESTAELYQRIATNQAALGLSGAGVARVVETIGKSMVISGASTASADAALVQLGQAFASGTLRGEELNSVLEQAPALAKAIADGMGVTVGALRDLGAAGKLTSAQVVDALNKSAASIDANFAKMGATIGQSGTLLKNAAVEWFGRLSETSGAAAGASTAISALAANFGPLVAAGAAMAAVPLAAKLASMTKAAWDANLASVAQAKSALGVAQAKVAETAATAALTTARVAELRSAVLAAQGAVALEVATNGLIPAQAKAAAAETAHALALSGLTAAQRGTTVASSLAGKALGMIGGPLGLITLAVSAGVYAWQAWASKTDAAAKSLADMSGPIDEVIGKFNDLNQLQRRQVIGFKTDELKASTRDVAKAVSELGNSFAPSLDKGVRAAADLRAEFFKELQGVVSDTKLSTKDVATAITALVDKYALVSRGGEDGRVKMEALGATLIGLNEKTRAQTEALAAFTGGLDTAGKAAQSLANGMAGPAWAKYLKDLTNARDEIGLSAQQLGEYKATLQGANGEQAKTAGIITGQTDAYQDLQKAIAAKDKKAEEGARTSLDNFVKQEAAARGAIAYTQVMAKLQAQIAAGIAFTDEDFASTNTAAEAARAAASNKVFADDKTRRVDIVTNTTVKVPKGAARSAENAAATAAKQQLDQQVDDVKNALAVETAAYDAADKKIQAAYTRGDLSSRSYYDQKIDLAQKSGAAQEAAIQKEIDILTAGDKAGKNHADTQKKIADAEKNLSVARTKNGADLKNLRDEEDDYFRKGTGENIKAIEDQILASDEQTKKLKEQAAEYGLTAKQVDVLRLARIDERIATLESAKAASILLGRSQDDIDVINKKIAALGRLKEVTASQDAAQAVVDYQKSVTDANTEIGKTLSDALFRGFEDGKGFAENMKDTVVNAFKTMILQPTAQAIVTSGANTVTNALGMTDPAKSNDIFSLFSGSSSGSGSGLINGAIGLYQKANTAYKAYGAISGLLGASAASATATAAGASAAAGYAAGAASAAAAAGTVAAAGTAAAAAAAGSAAAAGAAAGAASAAAAGTATAAVGATVGGTAAAGGATAAAAGAATVPVAGWIAAAAILAYSIFAGGMFKGEKRYGSGPYVGYSTGDVVQGEGGPSGGDPNLATTKAAVQGTYDTTKALVKALGGVEDGLYIFEDWELSPEKGNSFVRNNVRNDITGQVYDVRTDLDTKDGEEVMKAYQTELKRAVLAGLSISGIDKAFQDYLDTIDIKSLDDAGIDAVMNQLTAMIQFRDTLKTLPFANLAGASLSAALNIAQMAGGMDALISSLSSYFDTYYTESEKLARTTDGMSASFASLGYSMPTSKAAFRDLVESIDLSTSSGEAAFAALMNLNQGFAQYIDAVDQAKQATDEATKAQRDALVSDIQEAYDRESSALTSAISNLNSFISTIDKFRKSLLLGSSTTLSLSGQYDEAKRQYEDTLAKANGGDTDAQAALQGAAQAFLDASKNRYASSDSYQRDFAMVQANLVVAQASAQAQVSIAKQQLDLMKQQVDGILNVNKNLISLAEALASFASQLGGGTGNTYLANNPDVLAAYKADSGGMTADQYAAYHYLTYGQSEGRGQAGAGSTNIADQYLLNNPDVLAAYKNGAAPGMSMEDWAQFHYDNFGQSEGRAYANGGLASEGWNLVGEKGPELVNFGAPGRVYTADQTRGMLTPKLEDYGRGDDAILALGGHMKAVAAEVAQLRLEAQQHAEVAARTAIQAAQHVAGATEQGADKTTRALTGATQKRKMAKL